MTFAHPNEQLNLLLRGTAEVIEREELLARLSRSVESGRPLRVMAGFDPTAPDLHLGHAVLLRKLRQFQDLGHEVIFLIGDFTAAVGDPSARTEGRPRLERAQIDEFARSYREQVGHILDLSRLRIEHNSAWLAPLQIERLLDLTRLVPLQRLASREDLMRRPDLGLHEVIYPVLQAYDALHLGIDVEIGGLDQVPNLVLAREIMSAKGVPPLCAVITELLEGTDAALREGEFVGRKMSKSCGNTICLHESPDAIRARICGLDDGLTWRYLELLTDCSMPQIKAMQADVEAGRRSIVAIKNFLADELVRMLNPGG